MVRTKHKSGVSGLDLAGDVASYAERSKNGNISCREKYRLHNHGKLPSAGQIPVPESQGPLSQMLSLPEKWDYTLQGLAYINREQIDAIRQAVHELERARLSCGRGNETAGGGCGEWSTPSTKNRS